MSPATRRRLPQPQLSETLSSDERLTDDGDAQAAEQLLEDDEDRDVHELMQADEGEEEVQQDDDDEAQLGKMFPKHLVRP